MTTEMNLAYQFDFVYDGQKIFRELLNAMANPGTVKNISNERMLLYWQWAARC